MSVNWEWTPNTGLGPIKLGERIDVYENSLGAVLDEGMDEDRTGWDRYKLPNMNVYLDVEKGMVVSIAAYDEFQYKGRNIIGMNVKELEALLECGADEVGESVIYDDDDEQTPRDYFNLGLQLWTSEERVVSVSCVTYAD